jgi:lysozyme family protein
MDNDQIIDLILQNEGGYTDDPHDHGGPTNFGITAADLGRWLKQPGPATAAQVQALDKATARAIYTSWYIEKPGFNQIADPQLRLILVDSGVLFGTARAVKWLQAVLGVQVDGNFGPKTLAAVQALASPDPIRRQVLGQRINQIAQIVSSDPSQLKFLRGWTNRATALLTYV